MLKWLRYLTGFALLALYRISIWFVGLLTMELKELAGEAFIGFAYPALVVLLVVIFGILARLYVKVTE